MSRAYRYGMDKGLRAELLRRVEPDQAARKARDLDAMLAVDGANLPWLRDVIAGHGWPGQSLVGADGAHAAWLLAQHADADPVFQRQCLDLLAAAVEAGEATVIELAYLTDRVLLHEGQPQVYGTQLTRDASGRMVPCGIRTASTNGARPWASNRSPSTCGTSTVRGDPRHSRRESRRGCDALTATRGYLLMNLRQVSRSR